MFFKKQRPYKDIFFFVFLKILLLCGLSFVLTLFPKPHIHVKDLTSFVFKTESQENGRYIKR